MITLLPIPRVHQCEVPLNEMFVEGFASSKKYRRQRSEYNGKDPERCMSYAAYLWDGKHYCPLHAGRKAIEELMK